MMWDWDGGTGLWMLVPMALMLLFWTGVVGLVVWAIVALARRYGPGSTTSPSRGDPIDVAKERYARGEIDRAQFDQIRRDLS